MIPALRKIQNVFPENETVMVLPNESLREIAYDCADFQIEFQVGGLLGALPEADLAIASTGTVTMECAYFGVPTVTLYKTSWTTYEIARRMVKVKSLTMPNLLAGEEIYPEFIQGAATPENIARAALDLLRDEGRRAQIKAKLAKVIASLGGPGATHRAAQAIARLLGWRINANKQEHELLTNGH
jgi:lipid-A-disaccharide synthase